MKAQDQEDSRRQVLRKFGLLLDLFSDIERSGRDTEFSENTTYHNDPRIHYVFDENVFELLIDPTRNAHFCANFYGTGWDRGARAKRYSAQAALIAGEYLFSDGLPGMATDGKILVSEWHYYQLVRRLRKIRADLRQAQENDTLGSGAGTFMTEAMFGLGRRNEIDNLSLDRLIKSIKDRDLRSDAELFAASIPPDHTEQARAAVGRFILAREWAPLLAKDDRLEPLQQISRIYETVWPRIQSLSARFRPENEHEANLLREWIAEWVKVLGDEHITDRGERGEGVDSDARTVGYIHWIAERKLKRTERVVLVTGDTKLFDAYRRWHSKRDPGEAFLLRRINQFSPLLNPHDAPNEIGAGEGSKPLFDTLRSALDAPMLTFNLRRDFVDDNVPSQLDPRREHFAHFLMKDPHPEKHPITRFFTFNLDRRWWETRETAFGTLKTNWQAAERAAIGMSFPALKARWERREGAFAQIADRAKDGDWSLMFSEFYSSLLAKIARDGLDSDIAFAIDMVQARLRDQRKRSVSIEARAPLRVQLRFPAPNGSMESFSKLLVDCEHGDERASEILDPLKNARLRRRTDLVFALAAALNLRAQLWDDAERFASDALNALINLAPKDADEFGFDDKERAAIRSEYEYLSIIARRFVIAQTEPSMERQHGPESYDVWRPKLEAIERYSERLVAAHKDSQPRRHFRALVELAASRVFYLEWGAVMTPAQLEYERFGREFASLQCKKAIRDVREAWKILDVSENEVGEEASLQLAVNAGVIDLLTKSPAYAYWRHNFFSQEERTRIAAQLARLRSDVSEVPPIVAIDGFAFLYWFERKPEDLDKFEGAIQQRAWKELPLDNRWALTLSGLVKRFRQDE